MFLEKLNLGTKAKCMCDSCKGTGVYKGYAEKNQLGVICYHCNGKGYYELKLDQNNQLYKDQNTKIVYKVNNEIIVGRVTLFNNLIKRNDIKYVIYGTVNFSSSKYLIENDTEEIYIIKYEDFLNGIYPLPIIKYICPRQFLQTYGETTFDNNCNENCQFGLFSECKKFGKQECWNLFYENANTNEEKQKILKNI